MATVSPPWQTASIKFLPVYVRSVPQAMFFWTILACWQALLPQVTEAKSSKYTQDQEWTTDTNCWITI